MNWPVFNALALTVAGWFIILTGHTLDQSARDAAPLIVGAMVIASVRDMLKERRP